MRRLVAASCLLPLLAACANLYGAGPGALSTTPPVTELSLPSERTTESFEIEAYFERVEVNLLARGLLRDDGGGPDVPFTDVMLARNFDALAFSEEFSGVSGRLVRQSAQSTLHRWAQPVRIETVVGASVDDAQAKGDVQAIRGYADRLGRLTGHPISNVRDGGNFHVLVLNDQELGASGPLLRTYMPELSTAQVRFVEEITRDTYCVVFASDPAQNGRYERAVAVIRAELPDRLRTSCIHEEIAQGLGLANDSAQARPSIFNDDDEFGRLTNHDELLLQMLYDPKLTPGMNGAEAAPLVRQIATGLMSPAT